MKIAIIGTRGIPNRYGGFEQLAEELSVGLLQKGHAVTVYNSHKHPYAEKKFRGVDIIHCYDATQILGTAGQFIYDLNCIRDARKRNFDVLLFLGYTSSSVWRRFYPKKAVIIYNMDGLEWKRSKYSKPVRRFLQYAEKLAVRYSDHLVADSPVIQDYLADKYHVQSGYIPYGAAIAGKLSDELLAGFGLTAQNYFMLMARMEPENNIEMILDGFHSSQGVQKFIVLGDTGNSFGRKMRIKFENDERIVFTGAIYDSHITHTLRRYCRMYFHGHSVGGTNPSLLEAMADGALIAAHDNAFNRAVLGEDGYYFGAAADIEKITRSVENGSTMIINNLKKIKEQYNWPAIIQQYHDCIMTSYKQHKG